MFLKLDENDNFDLSDLKFNDPQKNKTHYLIEPNESFHIQLDNINYNDNKFYLQEREQDFFNKFDTFCVKYINLKSMEWFNKDFSIEKLTKTLQKSNIEESFLNIEKNNFLIFNQYKTLEKSLNDNEKISLILEFKGILFYSKTFKLDWNLVQVKRTLPKSLFI